jgi:hypothetical protein
MNSEVFVDLGIVASIILGLIVFAIANKSEEIKEVMTPAQEAKYELVTADNVDQVVDHQILHAMGADGYDKDHPAIAARKAEKSD